MIKNIAFYCLKLFSIWLLFWLLWNIFWLLFGYFSAFLWLLRSGPMWPHCTTFHSSISLYFQRGSPPWPWWGTTLLNPSRFPSYFIYFTLLYFWGKKKLQLLFWMLIHIDLLVFLPFSYRKKFFFLPFFFILSSFFLYSFLSSFLISSLVSILSNYYLLLLPFSSTNAEEAMSVS